LRGAKPTYEAVYTISEFTSGMLKGIEEEDERTGVGSERFVGGRRRLLR